MAAAALKTYFASDLGHVDSGFFCSETSCAALKVRSLYKGLTPDHSKALSSCMSSLPLPVSLPKRTLPVTRTHTRHDEGVYYFATFRESKEGILYDYVDYSHFLVVSTFFIDKSRVQTVERERLGDNDISSRLLSKLKPKTFETPFPPNDLARHFPPI